VNLLMAACAWNLRKWMLAYARYFCSFNISGFWQWVLIILPKNTKIEGEQQWA
jgi:hypothetical protein